MIDSKERTQTSLVEENLAIGHKMMEIVNSQDLDRLDDLLIPEYENKQLQLQSREDLKEILRRQYEGLPDVHRTIENIIADEDTVWIVPSYRIVDGKIVEGWSVWNPLDMFIKMGVTEYKGFPDEIIQPI
ncbi:MAG: ester cyclase [Candidatus Thorarchaeota archaeon]|jgi:predicted ester cyclase